MPPGSSANACCAASRRPSTSTMSSDGAPRAKEIVVLAGMPGRIRSVALHGRLVLGAGPPPRARVPLEPRRPVPPNSPEAAPRRSPIILSFSPPQPRWVASHSPPPQTPSPLYKRPPPRGPGRRVPGKTSRAPPSSGTSRPSSSPRGGPPSPRGRRRNPRPPPPPSSGAGRGTTPAASAPSRLVDQPHAEEHHHEAVHHPPVQPAAKTLTATPPTKEGGDATQEARRSLPRGRPPDHHPILLPAPTATTPGTFRVGPPGGERSLKRIETRPSAAARSSRSSGWSRRATS